MTVKDLLEPYKNAVAAIILAYTAYKMLAPGDNTGTAENATIVIIENTTREIPTMII